MFRFWIASHWFLLWWWYVPPPIADAATMCANVTAVAATQSDNGSWTFSVTVRSHETGWDKYADEWQIRTQPDDGEGDADVTVLGTRTLIHPHVNEQPFTRSLSVVEIPDSARSVIVAARDSVLGYCGEAFEYVIVSDDDTTSSLPPTAVPPSEMPTKNDISSGRSSFGSVEPHCVLFRILLGSLLYNLLAY